VAAFCILARSASKALRLPYAIALLAAYALAGCGGGSDPGTPQTIAARPVTQTDLEIAQMLYADSRRTPQGFYQEAAPTVQGYVATSHVKSTDVSSAATAQYELCTDDWNTALTWSDQVTTSGPAANLVETNTTSHYYEFGYVRTGTPQTYLRARVYRCSYVDRSNVDLRGTTTTAGQLNQRPLTADELQQLSEYLWQFTNYNNYGNSVLKSSGASTNTALQHTLIIATLTPTATSGGCDRINILGWSHTVDAQTGMLRRDLQPLWEFGARRDAGVVETCNPN
jgi:hypothetical protein